MASSEEQSSEEQSSEEQSSEEQSEETQSKEALALEEVQWTAEPDFSGRSFVNTLQKSGVQILVERERFGGLWRVTVTKGEEGFVVASRRWPGSVEKSLREAVRYAVEVARKRAQ
jgi:FtsZ-interacting cell division protein ZipA